MHQYHIIASNQLPPLSTTWYVGMPPTEDHAFYGQRYSVPVWIETGRCVRWDGISDGWVDYLWRDGSAPEMDKLGRMVLPANARWLWLPEEAKVATLRNDDGTVLGHAHPDYKVRLIKNPITKSGKAPTKPVIKRGGHLVSKIKGGYLVSKKGPVDPGLRKGNGDLAALRSIQRMIKKERRAAKLRKAGADAYATKDRSK